MKSKIIAAIAIAAGAGLFAQPAFANVITITGGAGTVTCTASCEAFTGAGSPGEPTGLGVLSSTAADEYDGTPANPADEAARLNTLAGTSFVAGDATVIAGSSASGGNPDDSFVTLALFIVMKIGNMEIFIKNTSGGALTIDYDSFEGAGSGLSHYTEFGQVPLPGAMWLMGAGLAGLGFAARRKKKT